MLNFAVRLIVRQSNRILLLHRTKQNGGGYGLIGGNVEEREFAREALAREAVEEAGIVINPVHLQLVHVLHRHKLKKGEQSLVLFFEAAHYLGVPESQELKKFRAAIWMPIEELPNSVSKSTLHALHAIGEGAIYSEYPSRQKVLTFWEKFGGSWTARLPEM
jgi:8-oxo-dGTP diphosphatase